MSKVAAAMIATGGAATVTVGGSYLLQKGTESNATSQEPTAGSPSKPAPAQPKVEKTLTFDSLNAFKTNWKTNSKCVKDLFEGGFNSDDKANTATELKENQVPTTGTFFKSGDDTQNPYKSCLIIDGKKDKYQNSKGKGTFTGTGTFVKGKEGFVNFNIAETSSTDNGKLEFKGVFYLLGKGDNANDKGGVKYRKDSKAGLKVDSTGLDDYFPKKGSNIDSDKGNYWGFITDDADKFKDMCETGNCISQDGVDPKSDGEELHWEGSKKDESGSNALKDGTSGLDGGSKIYEGASWDFGKQIEGFVGTGSKVENSPK